MKIDVKLPSYLSSFDLLEQHIRGQLNDLNSTEKGDRFARFVQRLVPQSEIGSNFELPELRDKKSSDGGVDLIANAKFSDKVLYIQSKLWVDRADTIDSVISKFQSFTTKINQDTLFDLDNNTTNFLLVTLSPLSGILERYKNQQFSSKAFYQQCEAENRIHFIDGPQILALLTTAYNKLNQVPTELIVNFETPYIQKDNVYIGVISSDELKALHKLFGDALFFENVRDFLGVQKELEKKGRTTPNLEIIKTIRDFPNKMLARNNGLVFGARYVKAGSNDRQLVLNNGSVVNGCQTTMCLVEYSSTSSFVLAKVVQTPDSWDITKSANYQTSVPDIDLELARYLRPQLVKRAASNLGVQFKDIEKSAFQLIDEIYDSKIAYAETRLLYIGLFSRTPNNVFASNYTELLQDLVVALFSSGIQEEDVFETLFLLQGISQESLAEAQTIFSNPAYSGMFERLYRDDSLTYRCLISILAICGAINLNIAERESNTDNEVDRVKKFLYQSTSLLKNEQDKFKKFHKLSVKLWMQALLDDEDDIKVRRDMYLSSKKANFTSLYRKLCIEADLGSLL
ncbi:MAG: hypothetical protein F9K25_06310 [Candidatus Contendobacter sp.]|nr:MAG: hypothetical protein F9K25_06310 [Candidatus Contendobacter sp.]